MLKKQIMIEHIKKNWPRWAIVVVATILTWAVYIKANDWVEKSTNEYLKSEQAKKQIAIILDNAYKSVVGASYQAHFVLGEETGTLQHSIPIYAMDSRDVYMYINMAHSGPDDLVNVGISVDGIGINFNTTETEHITKKINLNKYIKEAKKNGIHNFNENILNVSFRADPTQKTRNIVSANVLINIKGLPVMVE